MIVYHTLYLQPDARGLVDPSNEGPVHTFTPNRSQALLAKDGYNVHPTVVKVIRTLAY